MHALIGVLCIFTLNLMRVTNGYDWVPPANCTLHCPGHNDSSECDTQLIVTCTSRLRDPEESKDGVDRLLTNDAAENLTSLTITGSSLLIIPDSICKLRRLLTLNLSSNNIQSIPDRCFSNMQELRQLSLRANNISHLQDGLFDGLTHLGIILLDNNVITDIGLRVFSNETDLNNLTRIDLSNNRLENLDPWPLIRLMTVNGDAYVNVSFNMILNFTNRIGWKYKCSRPNGSKLIDIETSSISHIADILEGWGLKMADVLCMAQCNSSSNPRSQIRINVANARIVCDCVDFEYYKLFTNTTNNHTCFKDNIFENLSCQMPSKRLGSNVTIGPSSVFPLSITLDQFICDIKPRCPDGCNCTYRPANASLHVECTEGFMKALPLQMPELQKRYDRYKLQISDNMNISKLEYRDYLVNTSQFHLTNSSLNEVDDLKTWKLLFGMERLILNNNKLKSIPQNILPIKRMPKELSLGSNPWDCSCTNSWMSNWLNDHDGCILDMLLITCNSPKEQKTKQISAVTPDDVCSDPKVEAFKRALVIFLVPMCGFVLFVTTLYHCRFRLYARYKLHPFDRDECIGEEMDYDVFISCSSEDDRLLRHGLVDLLESNDYKVCDHERDFRIGDTIENNISRAIEHSKRTVCLVTENFLRR